MSTPAAPPYRYTAELAQTIELGWQQRWDEERTFHTDDPAPGDTREKFYLLDMFPYPSRTGLHVGHPLRSMRTDVIGRCKRMTGHKVLHALAYDAFGLPAEQYALQTNQHPQITTDENIAIMRTQLHRLGLAHDPERSFAPTDEIGRAHV